MFRPAGAIPFGIAMFALFSPPEGLGDMGLFAWIIAKARKGAFSAEYYTPVENCGLYWHLVDIIWIFFCIAKMLG